MFQRSLFGLIAVALMAAQANAQCGCGGDAVTTSPGAAAADGGCGPTYITRKIMVPVWTTEERTRQVTKYRRENRTRTYNVTKRVPVTTQKEVKYTVRVPYTETVQKQYTVRVPYTETVQQEYTVRVPYTETVQKTYKVRVPYTEQVTKEYTVMVPHKEQRTGTRTVRVPYKETVMKTVRRLGGHWETREVEIPTVRGMMGGLGGGALRCCLFGGLFSGCGSACDGCGAEPACGCEAAACGCKALCAPCCRTICRRVWVPEVKCCEVPVCVTKFKCVEKPYTYCVTVCKPEKRTKTCCVRKWKCETRTRDCCVRKWKCETRTRECCVRKWKCEERTKMVCCRSWKCVTEQKTCNYTVCVPYCETKTRCVRVLRLACKEIKVPCLNLARCHDGCGCGFGSRLRGLFHGLMSHLSCGCGAVCGGCGGEPACGSDAAAEPAAKAEG
ncbi:MAG: hypothetical protein VX776_01130 [Planctomycetota bacterium]|nr:hypothetical protein [Planctomycetota bacterium]MEC9095199.1 hypothetical protein [Planctomycetota bacterium]